MRALLAFITLSVAVTLPCLAAEPRVLPKHVQLLKAYAQLRPARPAPAVPQVKLPPPEPTPLADPQCGHIVELRAPRGFDSNMRVLVPETGTSRMPVGKALPACPGNLR